MSTVISITEAQVFAALRAVILGLGLGAASPADLPIPVVRGQVNRVAEPKAADYIEMWPLRRTRLSTNIDTYSDTWVTGAISGNTMAVVVVIGGQISNGQAVFGTGVTVGCSIIGQLLGVPGGAGIYQLTPTKDVAAGPFYLGTAALLQPIEIVVQCDIHGPSSADNATIVSTFFRDDAGVMAFAALGLDVTPLYADDPRQSPFINDQEQFEERWIVEVHLQANPAVVVAQQFAAHLAAVLIQADMPTAV